MKLFKFYKAGTTFIYPFSVSGLKGAYNVIIFGKSYPPVQQTIYDAGQEEASFDDVDDILRFRYGAIVEFIFERLIYG